jgi:hypothetical protein
MVPRNTPHPDKETILNAAKKAEENLAGAADEVSVQEVIYGQRIALYDYAISQLCSILREIVDLAGSLA